MLKARLPTQNELTNLYKEVELLRRDKKLKDDTIRFLQKENEAVQRELQKFEQLCEGTGISNTLTAQTQELDAENRQLHADIKHLKDVIRRQNTLLKNSGTSGNKNLDKRVISSICSSLRDLLNSVPTPMSGQVRVELEHQNEAIERMISVKGEALWHLLEIVDRALLEVKSMQSSMRLTDLPDLRTTVSKYSSGANSGRNNLLTTNSASLANLSLSDPKSLGNVSGGGMRRRAGGRSRLERSQSAPALNGIVPHPPTAPPPSAIRNIYKSDRSSGLATTASVYDNIKNISLTVE